jgi:hypothetical protein
MLANHRNTSWNIEFYGCSMTSWKQKSEMFSSIFRESSACTVLGVDRSRRYTKSVDGSRCLLFSISSGHISGPYSSIHNHAVRTGWYVSPILELHICTLCTSHDQRITCCTKTSIFSEDWFMSKPSCDKKMPKVLLRDHLLISCCSIALS